MTKDRQLSAAAWAGLAVVPLSMLPLPVTGTSPLNWVPSWDRTPQYIADWYADHRSAVLLQVIASNIDLALIIWFSSGLSIYLAAHANRPSVFLRMIQPAWVGAACTGEVANSLYAIGALAGTPSHPVSVELVRYSFEAAIAIVSPMYIFTALYLLAAAFAIQHDPASHRRSNSADADKSIANVDSAHRIGSCCGEFHWFLHRHPGRQRMAGSPGIRLYHPAPAALSVGCSCQRNPSAPFFSHLVGVLPRMSRFANGVSVRPSRGYALRART